MNNRTRALEIINNDYIKENYADRSIETIICEIMSWRDCPLSMLTPEQKYLLVNIIGEDEDFITCKGLHNELRNVYRLNTQRQPPKAIKDTESNKISFINFVNRKYRTSMNVNSLN